MEPSTCWSCGEGAVVADPDSGVLVCTSCGRIHDTGSSEFVHQAACTDDGGFDLRASSYIYHQPSESQYRDQKLAAATETITSISTRLGLSASQAAAAVAMAKSATDGNLATQGSAFLPALASACAFLVARSRRLPLSLSEAAETAYCGVAPLADLVSRIASHLELQPLPLFDYAAALERAVRNSPTLTSSDDGRERIEVILSQSRFLLRCASKWSLTTGRYPLPLIAAVVAFAAEVNGVPSVTVENIARDLSARLHTSLRRYKELVDALVRVAQELLPWGADVNAKNLLLNAPVLLRLMEMRSQSDPSEQFLESFIPDIAGIVQAHSSVDDDESKYLQVAPQLDDDDLDSSNSGQEGKELVDLKISEECLSDAYQNVLKRLAQLQRLGKVGKGTNRKNRRIGGLELEPWLDLVDDDWTKDMVLEDVINIDVGFDAPPPSFTAGIKLQKKRRARIEAAKRRIDAIRKAPVGRENNTQAAPGKEDTCLPQKLASKKRGKKRIAGNDRAVNGELPTEMPDGPGGEKKRRKGAPTDGIDWEDCVIELLLLHGANEEEIEQGQYRRLLELHVFCAVTNGRR
uniref:TFIIB-type domain-containing protein n=1 Tax=Leersia perrieri TaxID=77586 RepID=A0A0D9XA58_9ORYZ